MLFQIFKTKIIGVVSALIVLFLLSKYSEYIVQAALQTLLFGAILCYGRDYIKEYTSIAIDGDWQMCLSLGLLGAFLIAFGKFIWTIAFYPTYTSARLGETFEVSRAIGTDATTNVSKRLCPDVDSLVKDTVCADENEPRDAELQKINRFLRATREIIADTEEYLNVSRPDERWMSKKEMEDHEKTAI
jgi:hypothetical protein